MARAKEATIIVLDVGENTMVVSGKGGTSFFQRAKACVSKIIQKKIFAKPNDEIALLLMGADETSNDLNRSLSGFENIVEFIPLQMPSWDMVRALEKIEPCDFNSDWVDGLVVAMNFAKNETQAKKFANVRILLITNFITQASDSNVDVIVKSIQDSNFELIAISDCVEHSPETKSSQFSQNQIKNSAQTNSQQIFNEIVEQVGGHLIHIDLAETQLLTFQKKTSRAMPWNSLLTIGSQLKINISAYVSIQEEKFLASFKTESIDANTLTKMFTEYEQNNQQIQKPSVDDVVKAYMYGSSLVALEIDAEYKDTSKGLSCLGFSKRSHILNEYLAGEGCHIVLAQKNCEKSAKMFASLVDAMKQSERVMIARKVYNNGNKPTIVVLIPDYNEDVPYCRMIQLPFSNDFTMYSFPKLRTKKSEPNKEQEQVIQELVNAMDLMDAIDDDSGITEAFALDNTLNPVNQHLCRSVAFRALNPSDPLPTINPELVATIDVPAKIKKASENIMKEVEKLFPLEIVERNVRKVFGKRTNDSMLVDDATDIDTNADNVKNIVAIGTVSPVEDFGILLKKGMNYGTLAEQMQSVIYDLIFRAASIQMEKILECILFYREQSKLYAPFNYNNWIKELKKVVIDHSRLDFWQEVIVKEGFGLITSNEAPSNVIINNYTAAVLDDDCLLFHY